MTQGEQQTPQFERLKCRNWSRFFSDVSVAFGLALIAAIIWVTNSDLWVGAHWNIPAAYQGDSLQTLGWIKAASEGDCNFFDMIYVSRLGAPFGANWNDYPLYEKAFIFVLGSLARSIGLMAAANVGMMLTHVLATASFYLACRWFRWHRLWSAVGALLFGFLYYNTMRSLGHLLLGLTYTIPWAVFSSWLIATRHHLPRFSRAWKFCLFTSFLMGVSNPNYLSMYCQLLLISMGIAWGTSRRRENVEAGMFSLAATAAGFLLSFTGSLLFRLYSGANPFAVESGYKESEIYALRPIELFIPPQGHHLSWFSDIGLTYKKGLYIGGEVFSPYLGIMGTLILIGLVTLGIRQLLRGSAGSVSLPLWQVFWVLAYSVVGGINCVLAYCGIGGFQAGNRNSLFIACILLLWAVPRLRRLTVGWSFPKSATLAVIISAMGIYDQLPYANREEQRAVIQSDITSDRLFCEELERHLPAGAMAFQVPLAQFPGGNPVFIMDAYEHFRPYFFTKTLRFSYGSNKGRSDSSWQAAIERMPVQNMVTSLEQLGFHALIINRNGFHDDAKIFETALGELGYTERFQSQNGDLVAVFLEPSKQPLQPPTDEQPINYYGNSWQRMDVSEQEVVWVSGSHADIQLNPDVIKTDRIHVRIKVIVPTDRTFKIMVGDKVFNQAALKKDQPYQIETTIDAPKKGQPLRLETDGPPAGFKGSSLYTGTFALISIEITPQSTGE